MESCDAAAHRVKPEKRNGTYWWNPHLDQLKKESVKRRREYTRLGRRGNVVNRLEAETAYKEAKKNFQRGIKRAKEEA